MSAARRYRTFRGVPNDQHRAPQRQHPAPVSPDLERIALAVQACPAVAGLHAGRFESTVTHLAVGRLVGLSVDGDDITIGVVGMYPATVTEIAAQVREAVAEYTAGMSVVVNVEDLHVPATRPQQGRSDRNPSSNPDDTGE